VTRPLLFPRPRRVEWTDGYAPLAAPVTEHADPTLRPQGYRLAVRPEGIELGHADEAGRRYGRQTLGQLTTDAGVACAEIDDHPDLVVRGHMLDISRDRVPTRPTLERLVERLAACRYNHLQLYTEHTFAYAAHPAVWAEASPMTPDDMRWLDRLCAEHGVELAANQNTFGHMERWLRHDAYRHRAESTDGFERMGARLPSQSFAPTPDNAAFALELVREQVATVTSRRVNVGCDEVFELGTGQSAAEVAQRGKAAVFVDHLRRIVEPLLADGLEVQFWADMLEADIDVARDLAEAGAVAVIWGYAAPMDVDPDDIDLSGLPEEVREIAENYLRYAARGFGPRLENFAESAFRTWVAPGTSGWNSFVGRHHNARANIEDAVEAAVAHGVEGMLNTEWGDNGHMQPPFATLPALAYGGAAGWCLATNGDISDADLCAAVDHHLVLDAGGTLAEAQVALATVEDTLGLPSMNGAAFFYSWVASGFAPPEPTAIDGAALGAAIEQIDGAERALDRARPAAVDGEQLVIETRLSAALVRHGLKRLAHRSGRSDETAADLTAEVGELRERFRECWLARSRPGGLDDSLAKMTVP